MAHRHHHITRQLLHCYHYGLIKMESDAHHPVYHRWTAPFPSDMIKLFEPKLLQDKIDDALKNIN